MPYYRSKHPEKQRKRAGQTFDLKHFLLLNNGAVGSHDWNSKIQHN